MELQQLKYFKATAEMGSIAEAAEALFISAPALSTSISRLEKELGVKLFDRTANRITLNQQGRLLLRYTTQVLSLLDCAKTELRQSVMLQGQYVSVASITTTQWVNMITAFSQEHPQFTLLCTSITRSELINNGLSAQHAFLLAAEDDIPEVYADKLESCVLFEDHPVVMVRRDHPFAQKAAVDLSELLSETVFLPLHDYSLHNHLITLYQDNNIPIPVGNAYSHLATQQMVAQGIGVAFSTTHTPLSSPQDLCYVPIRNTYKPWRCRLYWRTGHPFTEDELLFRSFVERYYQQNT